MVVKFTPRLLELTYEASLNSYWRKSSLRKFLRASHVAESFLNTWSSEESKREFLDRLYQKLQESDKGKALIVQVAMNLSEQSTFPDLRNWEDSDEKIQNAYKSVEELKAYLKKQITEIKTEKEREVARKNAREKRSSIQRSLTDRAKLQQQLDDMHTNVGTQQGGYDFEHWFYQLLDFCEVTNRKPYKSDGRQIDGSLTHEGTTYLVELKFTKSQSGATDIDSLKAKVNKMADNTMGVMVSISGYSSTAVSDASGSKTPLLVMDASHLYLFLSGAMNFSDIVSRIRRHASQTGEAYLPVSKFSG